jgi:hypothetical protein
VFDTARHHSFFRGLEHCFCRAPVVHAVCNVFRVRGGLVSDYRVYLDIGRVYA